MLTIRELIKTLNNAFNQKLKKHRSNWEQNDPTADDYIKNRPFYTDENKTVTIIPKQNVMFASDMGAASTIGFANISLSPITELVVGQEYDIVWDGKKYKCIAYELNGLAVVGSNFMTNGLFDNEPFFITVDKEYFGGAYIATGDINSHTIEMTTKYIKKLDKKYLPDLDLAPVATSGNYNDLSDTPTIYTDVVRYGTAQNLTTVQKTRARINIGAVSSDEVTGVVKYNTTQNLTDAQKQQARANIGATDVDETKTAIDNLSRLMNEPRDGIAFVDQVNGYTYVACMRDGNFVTYIGVKSIEVTTMPSKTEYMVGDYFDPTGMIVTATTYDRTTKEITDFTYPSTYIAEGDTSVEITYVEAGITHITTIPITVVAFNAEVTLVDFEYTTNSDGTYTITGWKGTSNGKASTEIIIPNNGLIIM